MKNAERTQDVNRPVIGITLGDINSINVELVLKVFQNRFLYDFFTPVLFGSLRTLSYYAKVLKMTPLHVHQINEKNKLRKGKLNLIQVGEEVPNAQIGKATKESGAYAVQCIDAALEKIESKEIDALVTLPVDKHSVSLTHAGFSGHTGYLGEKAESNPIMVMVNEDIKVALVTEHVPIANLLDHLTPKLLVSKLKCFARTLKNDFGIVKPKIAVLGLNPHAGDSGSIGSEEQDWITETIQSVFQNDGINCYGPFSADGFFGKGNQQRYDGVMALYHDQGMIPFKLMSQDQGVNFTGGLPYVRTSPAHGTAFDLAGKGQAESGSFVDSLMMAADVVRFKTSLND